MKSFDLIVDEKVVVWRRSYITVEADTLDDAVKNCIEEGAAAATETLDSVYIFETEEPVSPEGDEATIEVMSREFGILGTNK